jgi:hypothetical protein
MHPSIDRDWMDSQPEEVRRWLIRWLIRDASGFRRLHLWVDPPLPGVPDPPTLTQESQWHLPT